MVIRWYHNSRTKEIESYNEEDAGYELKGVLYAYGDAVTTGFKTKAKAEEWAKEWIYCPSCDGSTKPDKISGKCFRCEKIVPDFALQKETAEVKG